MHTTAQKNLDGLAWRYVADGGPGGAPGAGQIGFSRQPPAGAKISRRPPRAISVVRQQPPKPHTRPQRYVLGTRQTPTPASPLRGRQNRWPSVSPHRLTGVGGGGEGGGCPGSGVSQNLPTPLPNQHPPHPSTAPPAPVRPPGQLLAEGRAVGGGGGRLGTYSVWCGLTRSSPVLVSCPKAARVPPPRDYCIWAVAEIRHACPSEGGRAGRGRGVDSDPPLAAAPAGRGRCQRRRGGSQSP